MQSKCRIRRTTLGLRDSWTVFFLHWLGSIHYNHFIKSAQFRLDVICMCLLTLSPLFVDEIGFQLTFQWCIATSQLYTIHNILNHRHCRRHRRLPLHYRYWISICMFYIKLKSDMVFFPDGLWCMATNYSLKRWYINVPSVLNLSSIFRDAHEIRNERKKSDEMKSNNKRI